MAVRGIILSRTEMGGHYFCSSVAVRQNDRWVQIRPLQAEGHYLNLGHFNMRPDAVDRLWKPRRIVIFDEVEPYGERPTHPEDRIVDAGLIEFGGEVKDVIYNSILQDLTFHGFRALFPNIRWQQNGKTFVNGDEAQPRSIGYVRCRSVEIMDSEFAYLCHGFHTVLCKIKAADLLARIRSGELPVGTEFENPLVRLALAGSFDADGTFDPPRCYIMLTGIE